MLLKGMNFVILSATKYLQIVNKFGLHDLHGNVSEWSEDVFDGGFYAKPAAAGPDPVARESSLRPDLIARVNRGGHWGRVRACRSASRELYFKEEGDRGIGFRPVASLR